MVRLGDVCTVISGTTPKSTQPKYWDGDLNWVTPAELTDGSVVIYESQRKITPQAVTDSGLKSFPAGTVLLSSRAPIGKVAIAGTKMYCNQGFKNLVCSKKIYNWYLYYFLKNKTVYLNSLGRGATFKEISKSIVENIEIPLPPIDEQRKIVAVLDKVSNLIVKRRQQLEKLDEMVKARFVDIFGDLMINEREWKFSSLSKLCDVRDGTHDSPEYTDSGYPLLTSKNFTSGIIDFTNCNLISKEDFDKINQRSKVDVGDIVMPMIGTIGNPIIVNTERPFAIKNVALIKFNKSYMSNVFIRQILDSEYFEKITSSVNRGGAQKFMALRDIRKLPIPMVSFELQSQFATFVEQTDKSKLAIQKSLEKLETLKKALMQKYFG